MNLDWELAAFAVRAVCLFAAFVVCAWALMRMRRENSSQWSALRAAHVQAREDVKLLTDRVAALTVLVSALPQQLARPAEAPRVEKSSVRSYETARRLARSGATIDEIVATCGLAGNEARLLRRLHGNPESNREFAA